MKLRHIGLGLLLGWLASGAQAEERWQRDSYINQAFQTIALKREYEQGSAGKLVRWDDPIRYHIVNPVKSMAKFTTLMAVHLQQLSQITGLPLQGVPLQQANMRIFIVPQAQVDSVLIKALGRQPFDKKITSQAVCYGQVHLRGSTIAGATIVIPIDNALRQSKAVDCIIEETTQVLGLPNDSDSVFPSIFNDHSIDRYLSGLDYLLLKVLYDKRLKPGMSVPEVKTQLPAIIKDLRARGEISQAASRVRSTGLHAYLDGS
ncbi:DUF2927 domain-containing protein [Pokkaliibacter sp. CJK22405]|uniref:DUF2927 domain-containing protein n=1 Tax=Pokkaliibacter sp. CJK22405 TaxID=3384615 RepID=UPI003984AFD1